MPAYDTVTIDTCSELQQWFAMVLLGTVVGFQRQDKHMGCSRSVNEKL